MIIVNLRHLALATDERLLGAVLQDRQHVRVVVVTAGDVAFDPGSGQPGLGQVDPVLQAFAGQAVEECIDLGLIGVQAAELILVHDLGVEAERPDPI